MSLQIYYIGVVCDKARRISTCPTFLLTMIFWGNILLLSLLPLCYWTQNVSARMCDDESEDIKVFSALPTVYRNKLPPIINRGYVVPNEFARESVTSQNGRQKRAIDKLPPHKAFHEFHRETIRPRIQGRPRSTRPSRPTSESRAPRIFPEDGQHTVDDRIRPTAPTTKRRRRPTTTLGTASPKRKRTRRPVTTPTYPHLDDTHRSRPTPESDFTRDAKPSVIDHTSGQDIQRRRTTKRPTASNKPSRTSGATSGTRPGITGPSGHFPPHKSFHDFHYEPVRPRLPGRRRSTTPPGSTRFSDVHRPVTPAPGTTTFSKESHEPKITSRQPDEHRLSQRPPPTTIRRTSRPRTKSPSGRNVSQKRKTTLAPTKKPTIIPDTDIKVSENPDIEPLITTTPRSAVTRRHTDRSHRRTKKPTSRPSEYTRGPTRSQSITQSSKALPPHNAFHDFHFTKIPHAIPSERTSYPVVGVAPSHRPTRATKQPRVQGGRGRPTSKGPQTERPRFINGKQTSRPTVDQRRQTPLGRRTTITPGFSSRRTSIDRKVTTQRTTSTSRQIKPTKHPQKDLELDQKRKLSSPSPRQFPENTRGLDTSKPIPPHKAFHEFHFQPIRPRIPGHDRVNGFSTRTQGPTLRTQQTSRRTTVQKSRPALTTTQSIWPRIPGGDIGFTTQQPIYPSVRPTISHDSTRPGAVARFTERKRLHSTSVTQRQSSPSKRPNGRRKKPTTGTKRPVTAEEQPKHDETFTTPQIPVQSLDKEKQKPTRRTQQPQITRPIINGGASKALPPHRAFHDFHYERARTKIPSGRVTGTPKPVTQPYQGRSRTRTQRPTTTLPHGIQPRFPNGNQIPVTQRPASGFSTQEPPRRPNGKRQKPTSATKRPDSRSRRPETIPVRDEKPVVDIQTFTEHPVTTIPTYSKKLTPPPVQRTQSRYSSDHQRPETTPGVPRHRTKPRFPGDRGSLPTTSVLPGDRRPTGQTRTQKPRTYTGTTDQIKLPPHKAFHEFHYAPIRPRFLADSWTHEFQKETTISKRH